MVFVSQSILYAAPNRGATAWYRCNVPGRELARLGHTVHLDMSADAGIIHEYDVIVFSNPATEVAVATLRYAKDAGRRVIVDMDDDPWHIWQRDPSLPPWSEQERSFVEGCVANAHRVTSTNAFLAEFLGQFNDEVIVLPNCLPGEFWNIPRTPHETTVIGWLGTLIHERNLNMIAEPVNRLLAARPDVELRISGYEGHPFLPRSQVKILPMKVNPADCSDLFAGIDIGLAPLVDNAYNRSKSDLKFLEYGAAGIPCVASDMLAFSSTVRHGENGFLAASADDWFECLKKLCEDEALRKRIAAEARKTAESRFIDKNIDLWVKAYGLT